MIKMTNEISSKDDTGVPCANCGHSKNMHEKDKKGVFCMKNFCECEKFKAQKYYCKDCMVLHSPENCPQNNGTKHTSVPQNSGIIQESYRPKPQNHSPSNSGSTPDGSMKESWGNGKRGGVSEATSSPEGTGSGDSLRGKKYFADATRKYAHNNKDKIREKAKKVYHKDKTKQLARVKTSQGNEKTGFCHDCNEIEETEFHHLSYEPNIFIELCKECHNKRHGREYYGR